MRGHLLALIILNSCVAGGLGETKSWNGCLAQHEFYGVSISLPSCGDTIYRYGGESFRRTRELVYGRTVFSRHVGGDIGGVPHTRVYVFRLLRETCVNKGVIDITESPIKWSLDSGVGKTRMARVCGDSLIAFEVRLTTEPWEGDKDSQRLRFDDSLFTTVVQSVR